MVTGTTGKKIVILDCTLRDGSYLIDYQFTSDDTYIICLGLERAGFKMIEIGHGTGLRSSEAGKGKAAASDLEYLQSARTALSGSDAQYGMFFIPGIGKMEDLELAAEYGMGFVRIGTNVTEIEEAKPFIERAKKLGLNVSSNLMKSYAVPIDEFVRQAKKADEYGADIITIVDSAGGMFPKDIRTYVQNLIAITDKKIGFHGHNNLQLAIANTLEAIEAGASIVDASLQGMGRSAGNAQTEILVMVLEKMGYITGIDSYHTLDLGERIVKPMMHGRQGVDDFSIVAGIAQFHSSFSEIISKAAQKHGIDPRKLIVEVSDVDRVNVTQELAEETAVKIKNREHYERKQFGGFGLHTGFIYKRRIASPLKQLESVAEEIFSLSKKTGLDSVFSITLSMNGKTTFPFIRKGTSMIIGNCEANSIETMQSFIQFLDGRMDWVLLDESCSSMRMSGIDKSIIKSSFSWYSEDRALMMSVLAYLSQKGPDYRVLLLADPESIEMITLFLKRHGSLAYCLKSLGRDEGNKTHLFECLEEMDAVVSFGEMYSEALDEGCFQVMKKDMIIYAAKPNAFSKKFIDAAMTHGFNISRIDSRVGFAAELALVIGTRRLTDSMGTMVIEGIPVVSGGIIGAKGSIIVDSRMKPTTVIGIADGSGGLLAPEEEAAYQDAIESVKLYILENLFRTKY